MSQSLVKLSSIMVHFMLVWTSQNTWSQGNKGSRSKWFILQSNVCLQNWSDYSQQKIYVSATRLLLGVSKSCDCRPLITNLNP